MSINFDRAAAFYDDTRGLPATAYSAFAARLTEALGDAETVLEVGVGTGRVAIPLSERGFHMTGIDVSEQMLAVLRQKSSAVQAHVGDATSLAFTDGSFDAVVAVDVLHLVAEWRAALAEVVRVLQPGGRIVLSTFATVEDPTGSLSARMFAAAGGQPRRVGANIDAVIEHLTQRFGATSVELEPIPYTTQTSLRRELDDFRAGIWSRYWGLDEAVRREAADTVEIALANEGADLDKTLDTKMSLRVLRVVLPN